ncbi:EAL domain-containing protein [Candidatus Accumulibacter sp. ACC003]|uniref:EAL domain-containing protein n=1 Tax=Candidatus Accumulibacter sp. ACC003 TaxID=2823334 RepID=UPI0025C59D2E|nr:EAL domain-containing protein [Candidatus Accumulibacter sp. ACC003]
MNQPIKILLVEDSEDDARLTLRALRQGGFEPLSRRVQSAVEVHDALAQEPWDAVIADFKMPSFTGLEALTIVRASGLDIPFILVSGKIGEETAVAAMKAGANDYLMKENLARLAPALLRELKETAMRAAHRHSREQLVQSEQRLRTIIDTEPECIKIVSQDGRILEMNAAGLAMLEADSLPEVWSKALLDFLVPEHCAAFTALHRRVMGGASGILEFEVIGLKGGRRWLETHATPLPAGDGEAPLLLGVTRDISERKALMVKLAERQAHLHAVLQAIPDLIWLKDAAGVYLTCNASFQRFFGASEADIVGKTDYDFLDRAQADFFRSHDRKAMAAGKPSMNEEWLTFADDSYRGLFETIKTPVYAADGALIGVLGVARDITARKKAADRIAYLNRVYAVLSGINTLIVHVRDRGELTMRACQIAVEQGGFHMSLMLVVDPGVSELLTLGEASRDENLLSAVKGLTAAREQGPVSLSARVIEDSRAIVANDLQNTPAAFLREAYAASGARSMAIVPLLVAEKTLGALVLYASEIDFFHAEEMRLLSELAGNIGFAIDFLDKQKRLDYLAYYDPLTDLANRNLLADRLQQALTHARRAGRLVAVMLLDLDRFKVINDSLGHGTGDALLQVVAQRLTACVRAGDTVARLGGDEFVVVMGDVASENDIAPLARKVLDAIAKDITVGGHDVVATASVGIAVSPRDGEQMEILLKNADGAMYRAKDLGRNSFQFYTPEMNSRTLQRLELEAGLRRALERDELLLFYQPKVELQRGQVVGAEALIRWRHPVLGMVSPADFIPLAEETGLIVAIGEWVITTACEQLKAWQNEGLAEISVAVNLSARQFMQEKLAQVVTEALRSSDVKARCLELEVTESAVMQDPERTVATLRELKQIGVRLSLDDFGTGYSSLNCLKRFPIDTLKIDQSFVRDITTDPDDAAIAVAIISLAHSLRRHVVAEGVETEAQLNYLRRHRCDEMQGYYFSRPLPAEEFAALLRAGRSLALGAARVDEARCLLLVDDEPSIVAALRRVLRRDGYHILTAASAAEGLELLALNDVQVIVSDQRMPVMNGTEFLGRVKEMHPDTIRIVLSGYTDLKSVTDAVNRGAIYKFLTKPWDDDLLREHIREAFIHYEARKGRA